MEARTAMLHHALPAAGLPGQGLRRFVPPAPDGGRPDLNARLQPHQALIRYGPWGHLVTQPGSWWELRFWTSFHLLPAHQMASLMDLLRTWFPSSLEEIYCTLLTHLIRDSGGVTGRRPFTIRPSDMVHAIFTLVGRGTVEERGRRVMAIPQHPGWFVAFYEDALFYLQLLHRLVHPDVMRRWNHMQSLCWTGMFREERPRPGWEAGVARDRQGTPVRWRAWLTSFSYNPEHWLNVRHALRQADLPARERR